MGTILSWYMTLCVQPAVEQVAAEQAATVAKNKQVGKKKIGRRRNAAFRTQQAAVSQSVAQIAENLTTETAGTQQGPTRRGDKKSGEASSARTPDSDDLLLVVAEHKGKRHREYLEWLTHEKDRVREGRLLMIHEDKQSAALREMERMESELAKAAISAGELAANMAADKTKRATAAAAEIVDLPRSDDFAHLMWFPDLDPQTFLQAKPMHQQRVFRGGSGLENDDEQELLMDENKALIRKAFESFFLRKEAHQEKMQLKRVEDELVAQREEQDARLEVSATFSRLHSSSIDIYIYISDLFVCHGRASFVHTFGSLYRDLSSQPSLLHFELSTFHFRSIGWKATKGLSTANERREEAKTSCRREPCRRRSRSGAPRGGGEGCL
jgi:hypothetical protein